MQSELSGNPLADSPARSSDMRKLRLRIAVSFLGSILLATIIIWMALFLISEPPLTLPLAVQLGTLVSIGVAWPLILCVLCVALIFATSVSRHPHLWGGATVAAAALGSFALAHYMGQYALHVFDLAAFDWFLICLFTAHVAGAAAIFSACSIWSPLEKSEVSSTHASSPWIRRGQAIAVALLGLGAPIVGIVCLDYFTRDPCPGRSFLHAETGKCVEAYD